MIFMFEIICFLVGIPSGHGLYKVNDQEQGNTSFNVYLITSYKFFFKNLIYFTTMFFLLFFKKKSLNLMVAYFFKRWFYPFLQTGLFKRKLYCN